MIDMNFALQSVMKVLYKHLDLLTPEELIEICIQGQPDVSVFTKAWYTPGFYLSFIYLLGYHISITPLLKRNFVGKNTLAYLHILKIHESYYGINIPLRKCLMLLSMIVQFLILTLN